MTLQRHMTHHSSILLCLGLATALLSGCATLQFPWNGDGMPRATARNPVVKIVCLWEPAEGRDPDGLPCRGFAGQIIFLSSRNALPVKVDGDIRIYLFDDVGTAEEQSKPFHQFDFDSGAWQGQLSKSAVGPSYSVFVPYVRRGQFNAKCTLRVRLHPKSGPLVFSDASTLSLRAETSNSEMAVISGPAATEEEMHSLLQQTFAPNARKEPTTIALPSVNGGGKLAIDRDSTKAAPAEDALARMRQVLEDAKAGQAATEPASPVVHADLDVPAPTAKPDPDLAPSRRIQARSADE
jgi:hypothetical protein